MEHPLYSNKTICMVIISICVLIGSLGAESAEKFIIRDVVYDIKGSTRPYPLAQAVLIDKKRVFPDKAQFDLYMYDISVQFNNQRVFDSSSIDIAYGQLDENGIIPVILTVHTVDTWNVIAVPYPKYDSNSGFLFKLKLKDFNFFGSMQVLTADINYEIDNDNKSAIGANIDFSIPFEAWDYAWTWNNDVIVSFPQGERAEFDLSSGLAVTVPYAFSDVVFGITQSLSVNDRDDDDILYADDPYYFTDKLYINVPIILRKYEYLGNLVWTPSTSITANWAFSPIDHSDLQGPVLSLGHSLSFGRVDWRGNFRSGFMTSVGNGYSYNMHAADNIDVSIDTSLAGYYSVLDRAGLTSRLTYYCNLNGNESESAGDAVRGILNRRISSDSAITFNIDLPVKILKVNFLEMTGVEWTKIIGFEMHASPFFDMAFVHDSITDRYFSAKDAWFGGGLEVLVYPMKMRSIYGRISAGFDLVEVAKGSGLSGTAERDGESVRELLIGIGLHY
jgi:hypothetical protein